MLLSKPCSLALQCIALPIKRGNWSSKHIAYLSIWKKQNQQSLKLVVQDIRCPTLKKKSKPKSSEMHMPLENAVHTSQGKKNLRPLQAIYKDKGPVAPYAYASGSYHVLLRRQCRCKSLHAAAVPASSSLDNALSPFRQATLLFQESLHVDFGQPDHDFVRCVLSIHLVPTPRHDHHATIRDTV